MRFPTWLISGVSWGCSLVSIPTAAGVIPDDARAMDLPEGSDLVVKENFRIDWKTPEEPHPTQVESELFHAITSHCFFRSSAPGLLDPASLGGVHFGKGERYPAQDATAQLEKPDHTVTRIEMPEGALELHCYFGGVGKPDQRAEDVKIKQVRRPFGWKFWFDDGR